MRLERGNAVGEGRSGAEQLSIQPGRREPGPGQGVAEAQSARHRRGSPASQRGRAPLEVWVQAWG